MTYTNNVTDTLLANGRDEGFTKLIVDDATHRVVGGGIVGTHAGDMIGEIALAIEMGADAVDIGHLGPSATGARALGRSWQGSRFLAFSCSPGARRDGRRRAASLRPGWSERCSPGSGPSCRRPHG
jgi:hypothetical protein